MTVRTAPIAAGLAGMSVPDLRVLHSACRANAVAMLGMLNQPRTRRTAAVAILAPGSAPPVWTVLASRCPSIQISRPISH